jgi:hypothetical protein
MAGGCGAPADRPLDPPPSVVTSISQNYDADATRTLPPSVSCKTATYRIQKTGKIGPERFSVGRFDFKKYSKIKKPHDKIVDDLLSSKDGS